MADEQHGIEVGIDSTPAEAGKNRVVRSLEEIKQKVEQVGRAGVEAGKKAADGIAGAAKGAGRAGRSMDNVRQKAKEAGEAGSKAGSSISDGFHKAATGIDRTVAAAARLQPTLAQIESSANRVRRMEPFEPWRVGVRNITADLFNLRNAMLGVGAFAFAKEVANVTAQNIGFNQSLKIITGSQAGANAELGFAADMAERLGLRVRDITQSYISFTAAARGTSLEGTRQREVFESITKAGVAYGLSNDNIKSSLLAVQQIMSKGKVQAEELRGQLGERLPGAFQVAARAMNMTTAELSKLMENGGVMSDDFLPKFAAQLNKEIPNGVRSSTAAFNELLTQWDKTMLALGQSGFFEGLTEGAKGLATALEGLANNGVLGALGSGIGNILTLLGQNIDLLAAAGVAYGVFFAAIKVNMLVAFISQLVALNLALGASSTATALLGVAIKGLQAVMATLLSPLMLITAGLTGLVLGFVAISNSAAETQTTLDGLGGKLQGATALLEDAQLRAGQAAIGVAGVGAESNNAVGKVDAFAGAVGRAAQQLYELAKARQTAQLSKLIAERNDAARTYNSLYAKSEQGGQAIGRRATSRVANASGLRKVGAFFQGVGDAAGALRDGAARELGFGPDQQQIQNGMKTAKQTAETLDKAIKLTTSSLEQFVTAQDKAGQASANVAKPNMALNNALARQAGATTELQKAQANLAVVKAKASAELKAGTITQDEYISRVAEATRQVNDLRTATRNGTSALAAHNKMLAEASKNERARQSIIDRHDVQPKYLDQLDKDQELLDDMVGQWIQMGDAVVRYTDAMHKADTATINLAKKRPFEEMMADSAAVLQQQSLILQGRHMEAEALSRINDYQERYGEMLPVQREQVLANVVAEEAMNRLLEERQRLMDNYIQGVGDVRAEFEKMMNGMASNPLKAAGGFIKGLGNALKNMWTRSISESIFGGLESEIEDFVTGRSGVQAAVDVLRENTTIVGQDMGDLSEAVRQAVGQIRGAVNSTGDGLFGMPIGANGGSDNKVAQAMADVAQAANDTAAATDEIVVTGKKITAQGTSPVGPANDPGVNGVFTKIVERMVGRASGGLGKLYNMLPPEAKGLLKDVGRMVEGGLNKLGIKLPKGIEGISGAVTKAFGGAGMGMMASSIVKGLGLKQSKTGAAIGGAIGSFIPIPGASIVGGLIGGTIGGLFKKTPKASTNLSISSDGGMNIGNTSGNKAAAREASSGMANAIGDRLTQIAQSLGGGLNAGMNLGTVSQKGKKFYFDAPGSGGKQKFKEAEDAAAAAIKYALSNGAITGIAQASQRILAKGGGSDSSINAVGTYEDLLRQARKLKDPIKGVFDELKRGMDNTLNQLKQAGYTEAELGEVRTVFAQQQKEALEEMTSGYKDFIKDLTTGPNSGKTIFNQFTDAQSEFNRVKAGVAAGTSTQDQFTNAGQNLLDLTRQVYGSATPEFEAVRAELVKASQDALSHVQQVAATYSADSKAVADAINTQAAAAAAQRTQTNSFLAQIAAALQRSQTAAPGYVNTAQPAARQAY